MFFLALLGVLVGAVLLTVQLVQQARTSQLAGQDFPDAAGRGCWSSFRRRLCCERTHLLKGSCRKGWVFVFFFPKVHGERQV